MIHKTAWLGSNYPEQASLGFSPERVSGDFGWQRVMMAGTSQVLRLWVVIITSGGNLEGIHDAFAR
jgi:hypothetical protein